MGKFITFEIFLESFEYSPAAASIDMHLSGTVCNALCARRMSLSCGKDNHFSTPVTELLSPYVQVELQEPMIFNLLAMSKCGWCIPRSILCI